MSLFFYHFHDQDLTEVSDRFGYSPNTANARDGHSSLLWLLRLFHDLFQRFQFQLPTFHLTSLIQTSPFEKPFTLGLKAIQCDRWGNPGLLRLGH
jgi:hypothetical protein